MPDLRILKAGVLDGDDAMELEDVVPKAEQFTARRPAWLCAVAGAAQVEYQSSTKEAEDMMGDVEAAKKEA